MSRKPKMLATVIEHLEWTADFAERERFVNVAKTLRDDAKFLRERMADEADLEARRYELIQAEIKHAVAAKGEMK